IAVGNFSPAGGATPTYHRARARPAHSSRRAPAPEGRAGGGREWTRSSSSSPRTSGSCSRLACGTSSTRSAATTSSSTSSSAPLRCPQAASSTARSCTTRRRRHGATPERRARPWPVGAGGGGDAVSVTTLVLVVDDEPAMLKVSEMTLSQAGFSVLTLEDPLEALEEIREGLRPDVIVSDVSMPQLDGFQFYERVREVP